MWATSAASLVVVGHRPAPSGQVARLAALCQPQGLLNGAAEIILDRLALQSAAEEVGPQELAERHRLLGVAAQAPQFAGEAAKRIIAQAGDRFRDVVETAPDAVLVVGMAPGAVVEKAPERGAIERAQIGDHRHHDVRLPLVEQGPRQVVMIDDVEAILGPADHRDQMAAEKCAFLLALVLAPAL